MQQIIIEAKDKELQAMNDLLHLTKKNNFGLQASYDYIKKTLDGRYMIEAYEARFKKKRHESREMDRSFETNP